MVKVALTFLVVGAVICLNPLGSAPASTPPPDLSQSVQHYCALAPYDQRGPVEGCIETQLEAAALLEPILRDMPFLALTPKGKALTLCLEWNFHPEARGWDLVEAYACLEQELARMDITEEHA